MRPTPLRTQLGQTLLALPLSTLAALQWVTWLALGNNIARALHVVPWTVAVNWWLVAAAFLLFVTPVGRMAIAVITARILLWKAQAGQLPARRIGASAGVAGRAAGRGQRC